MKPSKSFIFHLGIAFCAASLTSALSGCSSAKFAGDTKIASNADTKSDAKSDAKPTDSSGKTTSSLQTEDVASFFISQWDTRLGPKGNLTSISLPLMDRGSYDFVVDWGDGKTDSITTWNDPATTHQYASHGSYKIIVKGKIYGFKMFGSANPEKITDIIQFGQMRILEGDFATASNLKISATDPLNLTGTTKLIGTFQFCSSLASAPSLAKWDTSKITHMAAMFEHAPQFNENISGWDVSSVTNMDYMFQMASSFNQPIGGWDVSKVTTMRAMFNGATAFTNDISAWNTGVGVVMTNMFDNSGLSTSMPSWFH